MKCKKCNEKLENFSTLTDITKKYFCPKCAKLYNEIDFLNFKTVEKDGIKLEVPEV